MILFPLTASLKVVSLAPVVPKATSFIYISQYLLLADCPDNCNGPNNGICKNGVCECLGDWKGLSCSYSTFQY